MHESTKQKIDEALEIFDFFTKRTGMHYSKDDTYLYSMLFVRKYKFWSDSVEEIEQYIAEKTILKDGV